VQTSKAIVLAALGIVVLAVWLPRVLTLDRFGTFDERHWMTRSANFYCALSQRDYANTFQREHPGVTTMWAGTFGFLWRSPGYSEVCEQVGKREHEATLREAGYQPIDLLEASRIVAVAFHTVVLVVGFLYAQRMVGLVPALVGFLLIAFDPFHIAHSRVLHVDALLSSFLLLALLAFLSYLRDRRPADLIVSGITAGLSWLTKSSAFVLLPLAVLLVLLELWFSRKQLGYGRAVRRFLWPLVVWGALGLAVFVLLWPAMWVDPVGTLGGVFAQAQDYSAEGHSNPIFFDGVLYEDGRLDASFIHFYPTSYLWRSSPIVLLGLVAAAIAFAVRRDPLDREDVRHIAVELVLFAVIFALAMNQSAKKFDRYLLPVYAPLDLLAGAGLVSAARWAGTGRLARSRRWVSASILVVTLVVHVVLAVQRYPYYFDYYNPVLGGARKAQEVLMIGWGEGLDLAARYLNEKPNADQLYVLSWYFPVCFSYFFEGTSKDIPYAGWEDIHFQEALNADYAVVYHAHQMQRYAPAQLLDYLAHEEPERSFWLNDVEYVRVYEMKDDVRADPATVPLDVTLGEQIRLDGYRLSPHKLVPGESVIVSLLWTALGVPQERLKVFVQVLNSDGFLVAQHDGEPVAWMSHTDEWKAGEQVTDRHGITLPADLAPGEYTLIAGMYRPSGERLPVVEAGELLGDALPLGKVTVHPK
jgi:4-amino-4-deoxy-L-arabinose transferase-like glycosyltransferase